MAWRIEYLQSARKSVQKIDPQDRQRIRDYLEQRVATLEDPRQVGRSLKGRLSELWRYRVGEYRILCELRDEACVVLVVVTSRPLSGFPTRPIVGETNEGADYRCG